MISLRHSRLVFLGLAVGLVAPAGAQTCKGFSVGVGTIGKVTNPPAKSGSFAVRYDGSFTVQRSGYYEVVGYVAVGKGTGAPVTFSLARGFMLGKKVLDETPPAVTGNPGKGWTYRWSIYYWTISKPFAVRSYLKKGVVYKYSVEGKGSYKVVTPYHRRNYGVSMGARAYYCGPFAASKSVGKGCVSNNAPTLTIDKPPVLGASRNLRVQGPARQRAVVVVGLPLSGPVPLGSGCNLYVDLAGPLLVQVARLGASGLGSTRVRVPADDALVGLQLMSQAAVDKPASPIGLHLSQGLQLTLGY